MKEKLSEENIERLLPESKDFIGAIKNLIL